MNKTNSYTELVIRYFEELLKTDEKQDFEKQLKTNIFLKKEYRNQIVMNALLEDESLHKLCDNMDRIEREIKQKKIKRRRRFFSSISSEAPVRITKN